MVLKRGQYTRILCTPADSENNSIFIGLISQEKARFTDCIDINKNVWTYFISDIRAICGKIIVVSGNLRFINIKCNNEKILDFLRKEI